MWVWAVGGKIIEAWCFLISSVINRCLGLFLFALFAFAFKSLGTLQFYSCPWVWEQWSLFFPTLFVPHLFYEQKQACALLGFQLSSTILKGSIGLFFSIFPSSGSKPCSFHPPFLCLYLLISYSFPSLNELSPCPGSRFGALALGVDAMLVGVLWDPHELAHRCSSHEAKVWFLQQDQVLAGFVWEVLTQDLEESPLLPLLRVEEDQRDMVEETALLVGGGLVLGVPMDLLVHELSGHWEEEGDAREHVRWACSDAAGPV